MNEKEKKEKKVLVDVRDLTVQFGSRRNPFTAVDKASFQIYKGETFGLVGESGSGKTTIGRAIIRINPTSGGEIIYDGERISGKISKEKDIEVTRKIQMIFQDPMTSLNPVFTVGHQIEESLKRHTELNKTQRTERIVELLKLVGINQPEKRVKQYPHELSGGMRQRIMIAMSLACNPKLLIADEPTTALDVTIQAQIIELLKELKEKINMSIIFITHDLGVVADICDKIAVMYAGTVVERGSVEEIFYKPQHPYTKGLLKSIPRVDSDEHERLIPIEGNPVDLIFPPAGCAFAPRCESCMKICLENVPPVYMENEGHESACWLHVKDLMEKERSEHGE